MNVQGRVVLSVLAGVAAGLLTWLVSDLSGLMRFPDVVDVLTPAQQRQQQIIGMVFGGLVGALLGAAEGLASGSTAQIPRAAGVGLLVGILSGSVGLMLGQSFFGALYREATNPLAFIGNVLARAIGWGFIGALAGTADGWRKGSFRVGRNGFLGGLLGGLLGGTTFEIVPYIVVGMPRPGVLSRLLGFVITGASIGLFVALVQQLFKEAWIRVVVGRNEGKEYAVDKAETRIGRAELSDIPLFGDPSIARTHAVLSSRPDGRFVLRDDGSITGTQVNGERVTGETPVKDGDRIQIGSRTLVFHERLTSRRRRPAAKDVAAPRPRPGAAPSPLPPLADAGLRPAAAGRAGGDGAGARLVAVSGPHAGIQFTLGPGPGARPASWVIGRDPGSEVALPGDDKASRIHARLTRAASGYAIEDAGSTNGTYVNGQKVVARQALVSGDTVLVGDTALRFE